MTRALRRSWRLRVSAAVRAAASSASARSAAASAAASSASLSCVCAEAMDRGVVAPLDEGTTLLLADPSLVAASIVARLPETLCCCAPVVPTKKMDSKTQRYHRRASRRSATRALRR